MDLAVHSDERRCKMLKTADRELEDQNNEMAFA
jgi:hypothetical protein